MLKKLVLKNWKSHEDTEINFRKGANAIVGNMGTGKTSILEAITYALFGTYPSLRTREITLDQTIMNKPTQKQKAEVKLTFESNGNQYTVERIIEKGKGTKKAEIREKGKLIEGPSTQKVNKTIEKILEMDYELYSKAIYAEQDEMDYFLEIPKGKRKEKIDKLLDLNKWEDARKKLTTTINILKDKYKSKKEQTKQTDEIKKIPRIEEDIKRIKRREKENRELKEKKGKKLEEKKKKYEKQKEKRKKYEEIKEKINKQENNIEYLEKELKKLPEGKKREKIQLKLEKLKKEEKEIQKKKEKLNEIKTKIKSIEENTSELKKEKKNKEKKIKKFEKLIKIKNKEEAIEKLKEVKDELENLKNTKSQLKTNINHLEKEIRKEKKHLNQIKEGKANCPTCGADLTGGKKEKVIKEKKQIIKGKKEEIKEKEQIKKKTKAKIEKKEKKKNQVEKEKEKIKEIKWKNEELKQIKEKINRNTKKKENLNKNKGKIKIDKDEEEIKNQLKEEERKIEYIDKLEEKKKREKELKELKEKEKSLEYKEEEMNELYDKIKSIESQINILKEKIKNENTLREEKEKRLKELKNKRKDVEEAEKDAKYIEEQVSSLNNLQNSLKIIQTKLREEFTEETNNALETIWKKIYPYRNYESLRIGINENGDYILQVKEKNGEWVNVEGVTSGGERSTASLCLRISLALVLTGELSWLILDEPTHNLDETAVEDLAKAIHDYLPKIVDQIFIITHEPKMKEAASQGFYKLTRNKEENEPTTVMVESK